MLDFIKELNDKYNSEGEISAETFKSILEELVTEHPELTKDDLEKMVKDWLVFEQPEFFDEADSKGVKVSIDQLEKEPEKIAKAAEKVDIEVVGESKKAGNPGQMIITKEEINEQVNKIAQSLIKEFYKDSRLLKLIEALEKLTGKKVQLVEVKNK